MNTLKTKRANWHKHYEVLKEYHMKHQTIDINRSVIFKGLKLGNWLRSQKAFLKSSYKDNETTVERVKLLRELDRDFLDRKTRKFRLSSDRRWKSQLEIYRV